MLVAPMHGEKQLDRVHVAHVHDVSTYQNTKKTMHHDVQQHMYEQSASLLNAMAAAFWGRSELVGARCSRIYTWALGLDLPFCKKKIT